MKDVKGIEITDGAHVKYSYNDFGIPVFTGITILMEDGLHIQHSNKVTVKIDDAIKYIEVISFNL